MLTPTVIEIRRGCANREVVTTRPMPTPEPRGGGGVMKRIHPAVLYDAWMLSAAE